MNAIRFMAVTVNLKDMNSRELVQQRRMLDNGDTVWEDSQLVRAAKQGQLCILDGIDRIHWSTAEMLKSLIHHRYLQLPDGSRLIGSTSYELLKQKTQLSDDELSNRYAQSLHPKIKGMWFRKVYKISDRFRLVALGDSESAGASSKWLNEQVSGLFLFHTLRPMSVDEQVRIVQKLVPSASENTTRKLVAFVERLRQSHDAGVGLALQQFAEI